MEGFLYKRRILGGHLFKSRKAQGPFGRGVDRLCISGRVRVLCEAVCAASTCKWVFGGWGDGGLPWVLEGVRMSLGDGEEKAFA